MNAESREKQKLMQYKAANSKRSEELEAKARQFDVLDQLDLNKLLEIMDKKENKIKLLER